jgi:4-amino-4-deoxy-L-arabinose transferase-like glycosyltransferase
VKTALAPILLPVLIGLLAWGLCLPSAARVVQLSPDMVEYVDVARRLVHGEGYTLGIKAYHIGGPAVLQDGLIHRTPLFTLTMAGMLGLGFDLYAVQVVNAAFGAFSAAMVYTIGVSLFGRTVGIAAGLLAAASPVGLAQQVQIQSDALSTALTLGGIWLLLLAAARIGDVTPDETPAERGHPFADAQGKPGCPGRVTSRGGLEARAPRGSCRSALWLAGLAGLLFGLGYLARPPVAVVGAALVLALPLAAPSMARARPLMLGLAAGMALVIGPVSLYSLLTRGRLSYSGKGYLYGVVSDADIMENGYANAPLSPAAFILADPSRVLGLIWTVLTLYLRSIFLEREWLAPLALGWPGALLALVRGWYPWTARLVLVAAAANFLFYGLTWSSWQDRFMLTTIFLLLPFAVDGLLRLFQYLCGLIALVWVRPGLASVGPPVLLGVVVLAVVAAWSPRFLEQYQGQFRYGDRPVGTRMTDGLRWAGPPRWTNDGSLDDAIDWIRAQTGQDTILAHGQPWPFTFFTGRPTVLLPYRLSDDLLRQFLIEYRVSYVLYDPRDPQRREYADQLRDLDADGVRSQRVKNLVVYDTRPLWQGR